MPRHTFACGLLTLALTAAAGPALAAETAAAADASKATATTLREIGSAMYFWSVDAGGEKAIEPVADAKAAETSEPAPPTVQWRKCPATSFDEVQKLLVPRYLKEMPRTDAWGHPLEICMDREGVKAHAAHYVLGVRSAGADGRFDGDEYTVGAFDRADANHDVVWLDGYFIAWPMKQPAK